MILITEATGMVGSEVVKRLSAHCVEVRAVTRDAQKAHANRLPHVQFVQGDFDDVDSMRRACSGVDRAFLLTNSTERTERQQIAFTRVKLPVHLDGSPQKDLWPVDVECQKGALRVFRKKRQ